MKNLELYYHSDRNLKQLNTVEHFCVNPIESSVFLYADGFLYCLSQDDENKFEVLNFVEQCDELDSKVTTMGYSSVTGELCLGTEQGSLLAVNWLLRSLDVVGCVTGGVKCLQWSPDEELLLIVTGQFMVLAMTSEYDPLWEQPLHQDGFGEQAFISVGWGSKQTQFHGSEGKFAAHNTAAPADGRSLWDDGSICTSWRGDGSLVAVSAVRPMENGTRCIRIFNREGVLQATSEPVPGLEMSLAWRPAGNLIASTQVLPNKYQVVFFEKNGLRHGEFTLPFAPGKGFVRQLAWNAESDVLSVWYEEDSGAHLLLCTVGNYHWYIKQRYFFPLKQKLLVCVWDPESHLKLHVLYDALRYAIYEWIWSVNRSSPYAEKNRAEVAVIDGQDVLLTAFAEKVVPPPMCAERKSLPASINQVIFGCPSCSDSFCVALSDGRLGLFYGPERTLRWVRKINMALDNLEGPLVLHHWLWVTENMLLAVATVGLYSKLVQVNIRVEEDDLHAYSLEVPLEGPVLSLSSVGDGTRGEVVVQQAGGSLCLLQLQHAESQSWVLKPLDTCTERLVQVYVLPCQEVGVPCIVGLSARCRLFVSGQEVAGNVTSLLLLPADYLLLTTSAHTLLCLQLRFDGEDGSVVTHMSEAVARRVERGSRLVTASGSRVVMQMPRGNLETITPRSLVLKQAAKDLDKGCFVEVFELFRKQRINLNLLVDHNPELFLKQVDTFVRNIKNRSWLSLLAVELSEEDVTKTTYVDAYHNQQRITSLPWVEGAKRATVCLKLCEAMQALAGESEAASASVMVPILTVLAVGHRDKDEGNLGGLQAALQALSAEKSQDEGLRHLLTLCDAQALFRAALGLHDLTLAARVAARANRDPKEYLPFLNELRRLDEEYRCYRIDAYLNCWRSALTHLSRCPEHFEEFLTVMQEHKLYSHALTLFKAGEEKYMKVAARYGEHLLKERKLEEAILMLRRANRKEDALEACRLNGDWQQALVLLRELNLPPEECTAWLHQLCGVLLQQRRFQEAAHLLGQCGTADEAVSALCQGRLWAEAQQVATDAQQPHLMEQITRGILENFEQLQAEITSHRNTYETHLKRLRIVRLEKLNKSEDNDINVCAESDLYSDTSSMSGSGSFQSFSGHSGSRSGRSSRSGKNRRKQERKLLSLKEGSPLEDLALLRAMHQVMTTCFALRREVHLLCLALLNVGHDIDATTLQGGLAASLHLMEGSKAEVWLPELCSPNMLVAVDELYGPEATVNSIMSGNQKSKVLVRNCELLEPQYRIPPQTQDHLNWKLSILDT